MSPHSKSQKTSLENKVEYPCEFCDKVYIVKTSYNSHIRNKHKDKITSNKENKKPDTTFDSEIDVEAETMIMAAEEEVARELGEGANEIEERLGIKAQNVVMKPQNVEDIETSEATIVKIVNIAPEVPLGQGPANFYASNPQHPLTCSQRIEITDDIQDLLDDVINDQNFSHQKEPDEIAKNKLSQMYNCFISQTSETDINQSEQNITCGECGKIFLTEDEGHKHMDTVHSCQECKEKNLLVDKKDKIIAKILQKIKMLTKDKRNMNIKIKALDAELNKSNKLVAKYKKEAATLSTEKETLLEEKKLVEKKEEEGNNIENNAEEKKAGDEKRQKQIDETNKYAQPDPNKIGKCKTCGYRANLEGLKTHRSVAHPESLKYKCPLCDKLFALKKVLRVHQHMHGRLGYECNICKKKLPNRNAFQQHRQKKCKSVGLSPNSPNLVQPRPSEGRIDVGQSSPTILKGELPCQMCDFKTNSQSTMIDHIKGKHDPNPIYHCDTCGTISSTTEELVRHIHEEHTNIGKTPIQVQTRPQVQIPVDLNCQKCDFKSNNQSNLIKHIKHQHDPKPKHHCDTCGKIFDKTNDLVNHLIKEHTRAQHIERVVDEGREAENDNVTWTSPENWNCHFCGSKDMTTKQRDDHICKYHPYKSMQQQKKQIQRKSVECIWGPWCTWYEVGKCWYKHDSNSLTWTEEGRRLNREQGSTRSQTQTQTQTQNRPVDEHARSGQGFRSKWCAYQDKCDRRDRCKFRHFEDITCDNEEEDFLVEMVKRKAQELTTNQWRDF